MGNPRLNEFDSSSHPTSTVLLSALMGRDAPPPLTLMGLRAVYSHTISGEKLSLSASLGNTLTY